MRININWIRNQRVPWTAYIAIFLITIVTLEVLSITTLSVYSFLRGDNLTQVFNQRKHELRKIYSDDVTTLGGYDPISQVLYNIDSDYDKFIKINKNGFIHNGHENKFLNSFPEKPPGILRIIMLGGSSAAGSGVDHNSKTISAKLELALNTWLKNNSQESGLKAIQVLNFGQSGTHTSIQLIKLSQYLVYFEPDLVISLDGFNDVWSQVFEPIRVGLDFPFLNWGSFSYKFYVASNLGLKLEGGQAGYPWIPFTSTLFNKVFHKLTLDKGENDKIFSLSPVKKWSKHVYERSEHLPEIFKNNISSMAAISCFSNFSYIGILQPHALEDVSLLTDSEEIKIKAWEKKFGDYIGDRDNYIKQFNKAYDQYEQNLTDLETKFSACKSAHFISLRHLFTNPMIKKKYNDMDLFMDNIHYTENGNEIISNELTRIIKKIFLPSLEK